jgi:hypothetical protein
MTTLEKFIAYHLQTFYAEPEQSIQEGDVKENHVSATTLSIAGHEVLVNTDRYVIKFQIV